MQNQQQQQRRIGSVNDIDPLNGHYSSAAAQEQQFLLQQQQYLEHQQRLQAQQAQQDQQRLQAQQAQQEQLRQSQPQYNNHQSQPKSMSKVVRWSNLESFKRLNEILFSAYIELFTTTRLKIPTRWALPRVIWSSRWTRSTAVGWRVALNARDKLGCYQPTTSNSKWYKLIIFLRYEF